MRLYAMYENSKKLLVFFVLLNLVEIALAIFIFEFPFKNAISNVILTKLLGTF